MQPGQPIALGSDGPSPAMSTSIGGGHGNTVTTKCPHCGVETVAPLPVSGPPLRVVVGHIGTCPGLRADA